MSDRAAVIGVGNPWRRDDGVGWLVADEVERRLGAALTVERLDGEPTRLIDAWCGADVVVVVDALRSGGRPGRVSTVDPRCATDGATAGTHGAGLSDAVRLAEVLDRLPVRLVVVAVEGADFGHGRGCTSAVDAAIQPAADLVVELLDPLSAPDTPGL